jgi:hypothetical protein
VDWGTLDFSRTQGSHFTRQVVNVSVVQQVSDSMEPATARVGTAKLTEYFTFQKNLVMASNLLF